MAFVPAAERLAWRERSIATALDTSSLRSLVELLVRTEETERLTELIGRSPDSALEALSHYMANRPARASNPTTHWRRARIWQAQGIRILTERMSQYYDTALDHFGGATRCYARADRIGDWHDAVALVQTEHRRESSRGFFIGSPTRPAQLRLRRASMVGVVSEQAGPSASSVSSRQPWQWQ